MPELKLYTVAELREWVEHNHAAEGLSERIIAPQRAYAIVHNPYVKDDDPVVAAIFVDGENAAYVTAFPEEIDGKRYWWFSALWCAPKYEGNGYGLIVVGSLAEEYGVECCLDRWGAKETVEIFSHFELGTQYTPRYVLGTKINRNTKKGELVYKIRSCQKRFCNKFKKSPSEGYTLRYIPYIDEETFTYIDSHSADYYFRHTQDFLNWVIQYSFSISAPLMNRVETKMPFSQAEAYSTHIYPVQVMEKDKIIGFYILKEREDTLYVLYMYYNEECKNKVFASICEHVNILPVLQCVTENKELADYLNQRIHFAKNRKEMISYSCYKTFYPLGSKVLQFADGDCFTA